MSTSVVRLICPNLRCRSVLAVPGTARGRMVRCRKCGTRVQVPEAPAAKKQPAPSLTEPEEDRTGD
ncbi:MAG: hypothetical protein ACODAQ_11520 [Phycisphaeraceae bacterium]